MTPETIEGALVRVHAIESDVGALWRTLDDQALSASDRQYLSRCFDLLSMELDALCQYLRGLGSAH